MPYFPIFSMHMSFHLHQVFLFLLEFSLATLYLSVTYFDFSFLFEYLVANEREVFAVLKLIAHTAKNFPGVFYHGKAGAVLPVIGRILPFLAEPAFRLVALKHYISILE